MKIKKTILLFFVLFITILVFNKTVEAGLTGACETTTNCEGLILFSISHLDNAHASIFPGAYNYKICCPGESISNDCNSDISSVALRLSSQINANVETNENNNYDLKVCLSTSSEVDCEYSNSVCDENEDYYCVAKISSETNAHIGSCESSYPISVCCKASSLSECGDGNLDQGENWFSCPADAGCKAGESPLIVDENFVCITPINVTSNCGNGVFEEGETCKTCSQDIPAGFCSTCTNNQQCDSGESCLCGECSGQQDGCILGDVCNEQGICVVDLNDKQCTRDQTAKAQDPECCEITKANWALSRATTNSLVELIVEGNEYCENRIVNFEVFEQEPGDDQEVPPDPISRTIVNRKAESTWSVVNIDDGFFQGQPEFYFIVHSAISSLKSDLLEIITCEENDRDCDGIKDDNDKCPDTPLSEIENVDSFGCAPGESSCVEEWDCTNAEWTECNEEGYRIRDITKCNYSGNKILCESKFKPTDRQSCLVEEAFPIFSTSNIIFTLLILITYYFIIIKRK
tara:strand:- start:1733 stop:3289 length:1557 start_codon:yes stop_codon:yes gene_type:complete